MTFSIEDDGFLSQQELREQETGRWQRDRIAGVTICPLEPSSKNPTAGKCIKLESMLGIRRAV